MIRPLTPADAAAIVALQQACDGAAQWRAEEYARAISENCRGWAEVDFSGGEICHGFILVRQAADELEVLNLAVAKAHRRKGVGSGLLRAALDWALSAGAKTAWLEVRVSNESAIEFYQAYGFQMAGQRPGYYREPREDALVLRAPVAGAGAIPPD